MTRFAAMIESGREADNEFDDPAVATALEAIVDRCEARGRLEAEGVWRLARDEALQLEHRAGFRPPGGWRALCALSVGTGILQAEDDSFVTGSGTVGDRPDVRRRLVESFTRWLIPPATAAGLFLAMGVHPLWGLRLARRLHVDAPVLEGDVEGWRDEKLMPDEDLDELRKGIFAALAVIVSGLRRLEPDRRYGLEALVGFVGEALAFGRGRIEADGDGLDVLIEDVGDPSRARDRSTEFAADELVDGVLVPAGAMRRYDDDTFAVDADVLREVRVGRLGPDAQRAWLQNFLVEQPDDCVA